jgi:DNA-binding HxlR family transcriptional regulator
VRNSLDVNEFMAAIRSAMPGRRSNCPVAGALDIVGDHWSLIVIRDLMFRQHREFGDFLTSGEGISPNVLGDRLSRLADAGLIERQPHPLERNRFLYRLTPKGIELAPTMVDLAVWGSKHVPGATGMTPIVRGAASSREKLLAKIYRDLKPAVSSEAVALSSSKG